MEQLGLKETDATKLLRIISGNEQKTLFIFDGYDEYRDATSRDITDILHRRKLQYTNLLITSRHPRSHHFPTENVSPGSEICLRGFSKQGIAVFIKKFFKGQEEKGISLTQQISKSEYLAYLSHFPAVLLLVSILWRDTGKLSYGITGFYQDFVKYVCSRYEKKFVRQEHRAEPENGIEKYHKCLMEIGKIAISGMKKDKLELSFRYKHVISIVSPVTIDLGFLAREERSGVENMITFPHKTLQEYFVAYYIINVDEREQKELLMKFCNSKQALMESEMILTFVQGLGGEEIHKNIQTILSDDDETAQLHVDLQLNYLSQHQGVRLVLPSVVKLEINTNTYPAALYANYLKHDTSKLERLIVAIEKRNIHIDSSVIKVIVELELFERLPDSPSLTHLDLSHNNVNGLMRRTDCLTKLARSNLTTLKMVNCYLTSRDVRPLLVTLSHCPSLKNLDISDNKLKGVMDETRHLTSLIGLHLSTLNMSGCYLTSRDVRSLLDRLRDCKSLTDIDLSGNDLCGLMDGTDHLTALARCHLTTLKMSGSGLTPGDVRSLLVTLPDCKTLTGLNISRNRLEGVMDRSGHLTALIGRHLTKLNMSNCDLTSRDVMSLLDRLLDCHALSNLDLSDNNLRGMMDGTDGLTSLARCHLTTLNMYDSHLTPGDVRPLLVTLPECKTLTDLDISGNRLQGVMDRSGHLTALIGRHLTKLNMSNCHLTSRDVRSLFDRLPDCHSLTDLDLSGNNLSGLMEETDNSPTLTHSHLSTFSMSECNLTSRDILSLLTVISHCLTNLDVSWNGEGKELGKIINMTDQLTNIRELNLQYNSIHVEAVVQIRETISHNCPNLKLLIDKQVYNIKSNIIFFKSCKQLGDK